MAPSLLSVLAIVALTGSNPAGAANLRTPNNEQDRRLQVDGGDSCTAIIQTMQVPLQKSMAKLQTLLVDSSPGQGGGLVDKIQSFAAATTDNNENPVLATFVTRMGELIDNMEATAKNMSANAEDEGGLVALYVNNAQDQTAEIVSELEEAGVVNRDVMVKIDAEVEQTLSCMRTEFCSGDNALITSLPVLGAMGGMVSLAMGKCLDDARDGEMNGRCFQNALTSSMSMATLNVVGAMGSSNIDVESFMACVSVPTFGDNGN